VAGVFEGNGRVFLVRLAVRDLLVGSAVKHQDRRLHGQSNGRRGPAQNGRPKQPPFFEFPNLSAGPGGESPRATVFS